MKLKKLLSLVLASAMMLTMLTACSSTKTSDDSQDASQNSSSDVSGEKVTLQLGFENSLSEPVGQAAQKWAELLDEKSNGTMEIILYPDSQLGDKSELIEVKATHNRPCVLGAIDEFRVAAVLLYPDQHIFYLAE